MSVNITPRTMSRHRRNFFLNVLLLQVVLLTVISVAALARSRPGTGVDLLSGLGYSSATEGRSLLLGAEFGTFNREGSFFSGLEETKVGLHLSDVVALGSQNSTFTVGVDGEWTRMQGPLSFSLGGQA